MLVIVFFGNARATSPVKPRITTRMTVPLIVAALFRDTRWICIFRAKLPPASRKESCHLCSGGLRIAALIAGSGTGLLYRNRRVNRGFGTIAPQVLFRRGLQLADSLDAGTPRTVSAFVIDGSSTLAFIGGSSRGAWGIGALAAVQGGESQAYVFCIGWVVAYLLRRFPLMVAFFIIFCPIVASILIMIGAAPQTHYRIGFTLPRLCISLHFGDGEHGLQASLIYESPNGDWSFTTASTA